jgi:hypothetical protein
MSWSTQAQAEMSDNQQGISISTATVDYLQK